MAETTVTFAEACQLEGCSVSTGKRKVSGGAWATVSAESASANGKHARRVLASSLSAEAQTKLMQNEIVVTPEAILEKPATLPLFAEPETAERVAIPENLMPQADARFLAIEPLLKFREEKNPAFRTDDGRVLTRLNDLVEHIAAKQEAPTSSRTVYRWLDRWDEAVKNGKNGFAAIVRSKRSDAKGAGAKSIGPIASAYLQKKYLDKHEGALSMYRAWMALRRDWTKIGETGEAPCFGTARKFLNNLPLGLKTLARVGPENYVSKCAPFIIRGQQPVMRTWISDHRVHDVLVRNRLFAMRSDERDAAYRVWLTAIFDFGSQAIVGFCFSPQPSWRTIHSAIRMGVSQYGFPQQFYWDNGEDFKKAKRQLEKINLTREVQGFNFAVTSALPKHPRSKPIEAYFTRFARQFDPMWGDAYIGNSPKNRREYAGLAQHAHKEYLSGKRDESPLPADAILIAAGIQFIEEYNNSPLRQLGGRTPLQVMEEAWPESARRKPDPRALDILLWEPVVRTVEKGGCVRMDNVSYEPTDEYLYPVSNLQGRKVHILRDPYNLSDAIVVTEDRKFVGELRPKEFVDQDPSNPITRDQIQAATKEQRRLKKMHSEHLAILGLIAQRQGWRTERELLLERAGLSATGTDDARALPAGAVPGATRGTARTTRAPRNLQPAFVSDAVKEDGDFFRDVRVED